MEQAFELLEAGFGARGDGLDGALLRLSQLPLGVTQAVAAERLPLASFLRRQALAHHHYVSAEGENAAAGIASALGEPEIDGDIREMANQP